MLVLVLCMQVDVKSLKRLLVESIISVCTNIILYSLYAHMGVILLTSVFMAPETAVCLPWREIFKSPFFTNNLAVVSVDEAHCIHEWLVFCCVSTGFAYYPITSRYILGEVISEEPSL